MDRNISVDALVRQLREEIAERKTLLAALEARIEAPDNGGAPRRRGITATALEILRDSSRPLHALHEIVPKLRERGVEVRSPAGVATMLLNTGLVERTAPGTYGLKPITDASGG